jgi:hypothetical protein
LVSPDNVVATDEEPLLPSHGDPVPCWLFCALQFAFQAPQPSLQWQEALPSTFDDMMSLHLISTETQAWGIHPIAFFRDFQDFGWCEI